MCGSRLVSAWVCGWGAVKWFVYSAIMAQCNVFIVAWKFDGWARPLPTHSIEYALHMMEW